MSHETAWAPRAGQVIDGRYRLESIVDSGGMGAVMRAEHLRMRRTVAVKFLHPEIARQSGYRARFEREVELATTIDHPNVVQCFDFGEVNGILYLVMELLEGHSLKDLLLQEGRLSTRRTAGIAEQLFDGMAAAHISDVVHRDLKPGNIWVGTDHRGREFVKILDFGLAKSLTSDDVRITKTGSICGTAAYIPPEALITDHTTMAGDVYALGLILLEMLQGRKVFTARSMDQTFLQQLVVPARIPRRIWDSALGLILVRSLEKHPADRPGNADELHEMLTSVSETLVDLTLDDDEIPPPPSENLRASLLTELGEGRYRDLNTLRNLPRPEPFERSAPAPDDGQTERIVLSRLRETGGAPTTPRFDEVASATKQTVRSPHLDRPTRDSEAGQHPADTVPDRARPWHDEDGSSREPGSTQNLSKASPLPFFYVAVSASIVIGVAVGVGYALSLSPDERAGDHVGVYEHSAARHADYAETVEREHEGNRRASTSSVESAPASGAAGVGVDRADAGSREIVTQTDSVEDESVEPEERSGSGDAPRTARTGAEPRVPPARRTWSKWSLDREANEDTNAASNLEETLDGLMRGTPERTGFEPRPQKWTGGSSDENSSERVLKRVEVDDEPESWDSHLRLSE